MDDGRFCAHSKEQAALDLETIYGFLRQAGWVIAQKKSDTADSIAQTKNYLGFQIDTKSMRVFLQPQKQTDLVSIVETLISALHRSVSVRFLAKVLGKMVSCAPALGNIPLIFARQGYFLLEQTVETKGWSAKVKITRPVVDSMKQFLQTFPSFDGQPISHSANAISLISIIGPPDKFITNSVLKVHTPSLPQEVFVSDASNVAVCSYSTCTEKPFFFIGQLSESQTNTSSGHRELLAVKLALEAKLKNSGPWLSLTNVFWLTDSQNLVTFLTKGSTKKEIQDVILDVLKLAQTLQIVLNTVHLRREDPRIQMADAGSRIRDSDDWSVDDNTFQQISDQFGPFSLDPFADYSNAKTERFFSNFLCPKTLGVDAFAHSWDNENAWLCPPVSKIIPTLRKIKVSAMSGILIIPRWKAAPFWPLLFPASSTLNTFILSVKEIYPIIVQNQRALSPLSGRTSFPFLQIQIRNQK